jgi:lysozyme
MSPEALAALTKRFEGLRLCVYPDPGPTGLPLTAGYGHTGDDVKAGMKVTQGRANAWLKADMAVAEKSVCHLVTQALTQNEFDALVDFEFNTGALEQSTLLKKVNEGLFDAAMREFARWKYAKGVVLAGLVTRRHAEGDWFKDGETDA